MNRWKHWLPGLQILRRYEAAWLPHDLMAGRMTPGELERHVVGEVDAIPLDRGLSD